MVMAKHRRAAPVREPVKEQVARKMATLGGQSRADLERDDIRGASSPLGGGMGSRPTVKRKER